MTTNRLIKTLIVIGLVFLLSMGGVMVYKRPMSTEQPDVIVNGIRFNQTQLRTLLDALCGGNYTLVLTNNLTESEAAWRREVEALCAQHQQFKYHNQYGN